MYFIWGKAMRGLMKQGTPTKYGRRYSFTARQVLADWLEKRAAENHRSVVSEVKAILEDRFEADREARRRIERRNRKLSLVG